MGLFDLVKLQRTPQLSSIGQMAVLLKRVRTLVAQGRMWPAAVVEHRNVFDDVAARFFAGLIALPMDPLGFERAKEALDNGVIPTIAFATHAVDNPVRLQQTMERSVGILRALVGMMQQLTTGRLPTPQRHP
jgi:hypothetical protein